MDRGQLQKFAQYLIASHPNRVLASAQNLADSLLQQDSEMNKKQGELSFLFTYGPNSAGFCLSKSSDSFVTGSKSAVLLATGAKCLSPLKSVLTHPTKIDRNCLPNVSILSHQLLRSISTNTINLISFQPISYSGRKFHIQCFLPRFLESLS